MAVLATSCEKDPDLSKLDNNFTVYTNYDSKTNFNDFKTYCLPLREPPKAIFPTRLLLFLPSSPNPE